MDIRLTDEEINATKTTTEEFDRLREEMDLTLTVLLSSME